MYLDASKKICLEGYTFCIFFEIEEAFNTIIPTFRQRHQTYNKRHTSGGALLPLLLCIKANTLIRKLYSSGWWMVACAKDGQRQATHIQTLNDLLQNTLFIVGSWCKDRSLQCNGTTSKVVIKSRTNTNKLLI